MTFDEGYVVARASDPVADSGYPDDAEETGSPRAPPGTHGNFSTFEPSAVMTRIRRSSVNCCRLPRTMPENLFWSVPRMAAA